MKIENKNNISFNAKFFYTESLRDVAKYAKENGCFEKLNNARKNIDRAYLNRRLAFELFVTEDDKKTPYVIITRYTPKNDVIIPKDANDYILSEPYIFVSKKSINPLKFGYEFIKNLGNSAPNNNLYKNVVVGKTVNIKSKKFSQTI